jgi:predicted metal-dependent peptidase
MSYLIQQCKRFIATEGSPQSEVIKTLGVSISNDFTPILYINENFYSGLTTAQRVSVLLHEFYHLINMHPTRKGNRDSYVWNLACDLAVNQFITELPNGFQCPKCYSFIQKPKDDSFPSCKCGTTMTEDDVFECLDYIKFKVEEKDIKLPKGEKAEVYYNILYKELPKITIEIGSSITGNRGENAKGVLSESQGIDTNGSDGESEEGYTSSGTDQRNKKIPYVMDSHEVWETSSPNKELVSHKIKDMVSKALEKSRMQGNIPEYLSGIISDCLTYEVKNWKSELRQFSGYKQFFSLAPTRSKLNRRFDHMFGYKIKRKAIGAIIFDSSGSIDDKRYSSFWKEVDNMKSSGINLVLIECDCDIKMVCEYKRAPKKKNRIGYGGTDFRPPFDLINNKSYTNGKGEVFKIKQPIDFIVYFTDGQGCYPEPSMVRKPTLWVMGREDSKNFSKNWDTKLGKMVMINDI